MMQKARQIPITLLALACLALPATVEAATNAAPPANAAAPFQIASVDAPAMPAPFRAAASTDPAPPPGASLRHDIAAGRVFAQLDDTGDASDAGEADYGDIMDDVNAVIDAMKDSGGPDSPDLAPATPPATPPADLPAEAPPEMTGPAWHFAPAARMRQGPAARTPVVVELFTAQGCAACPPAEDLLADLSAQGGVLVLSWHVDYWDYLGWPDDFARPEFSTRQKGYNLNWGARSLFTPQIVVGGETPIAKLRPADLMTAIALERAEGDHVAIARRDSGPRIELELTPHGPLPPSIVVQLVRYLPERVVEVHGGENRGRQLVLRNIVADSEVLARWDGRAPLRLTVTLGAGRADNLPADTRHALIVQHMKGARPAEIFAAIVLD